MSKLKAWKLWLFSSICFSFIGIDYLISANYASGAIFTALGGVYIILSMINYKSNNKTNEI